MKRSAHVGDDRLIEICVAGSVTPLEQVHLEGCDACAGRRTRLERFLFEVHEGAAAEADAAFSDERLAAQRARILHRVEQDGRPARVIAFPASASADQRPLRARPAARWIAGAAAAGLTLGLLAGHLAHDLPNFRGASRSAPGVAAVSDAAARPGLRMATVSMNEDEFLGEVEDALDGPSLPVLRPLNDLTPR
jgi:hypothetical protein